MGAQLLAKRAATWTGVDRGPGEGVVDRPVVGVGSDSPSLYVSLSPSLLFDAPMRCSNRTAMLYILTENINLLGSYMF